MGEDLSHEGRPITIHLPRDLENVRPELVRFFDAMVYKLHRNKHKGKWENVRLGMALPKIRAEINELQEAISNGNTFEVILEAADVANWALIIANVALEVYEHEAHYTPAATPGERTTETTGTVSAEGESSIPF